MTHQTVRSDTTQPIDLASTVVAAPEQVSSDLAGEAVILNLANGTYYGLNQVGARVWNLVQEPRLVSTIVATLMAEYEVDTAQCERDVALLLSELRAAGLIEVR